MKTTHTAPLAAYRKYRITAWGMDPDGGIVCRYRTGRPRVPRETSLTAADLVAGCLIGLSGLVWLVGAVTIGGWIVGGLT